MNDLLKTIHIAVTDPHFRARLLADPKTAIASLGLTLDDEEVAVLIEMRHLFARQPATWLSGQGYGDPMTGWAGGAPFTFLNPLLQDNPFCDAAVQSELFCEEGCVQAITDILYDETIREKLSANSDRYLSDLEELPQVGQVLDHLVVR